MTALSWWDDPQYFDHHADYMESYGEGPGSATRKLIFSLIKPGKSLLDAGCGPGWNYLHGREAEHWTGDYKGTDLSTKFIAACHDKWPEATFQVQDARNMTEKDGTWDVVLLQDIVEHTDGYERPILEALRVAKERVIVTFWRRLGFGNEHDIKLSQPGLDGYGASYSMPLLFEFLTSLGLPWFYMQQDDNRFHEYIVILKDGQL